MSPSPAAASGDPAPAADWPPHLPHREIDALLDRVRLADAAEPHEARRLLRLVAREAERLHTLSVRLTTAKLARADSEAAAIIARAVAQGDALRASGIAVLESRLEESERLVATVREAFRLERRAADGGAR